jgi:hypothetical protein
MKKISSAFMLVFRQEALAMKQLVLVGALVGALAGSASAQKSDAGNNLGTVTLNKKVLADGKPLAAGTYQVRLSSESPKPAIGESPDSEKYVEFVRGGKVVGREVATVVSSADIGKIAKGPRPKGNGSRVDTLKGGDYVRVWIAKGGQNYLINMPPST